MPNFKPDNYNSVSPYLVVDGAQKTIDFLKTVFNAEQLRTHHHDNGSIMHAEVRIDDTVIMMADAAPQWPAIHAHLHVYVKDVEETYQRALQAGAESVQEIQKDDQDKRGGFKDAGGTTWWIATQQPS